MEPVTENKAGGWDDGRLLIIIGSMHRIQVGAEECPHILLMLPKPCCR